MEFFSNHIIGTIVGTTAAAVAVPKIVGYLADLNAAKILSATQCVFSVGVPLWAVLLAAATATAIFFVLKKTNTSKLSPVEVLPTTLTPPLVYAEVTSASTGERINTLAAEITRATGAYTTRVEGRSILAFTDADVEVKAMEQLKKHTSYANFRFLVVSKRGSINNVGFNAKWARSQTKEGFLMHLSTIWKELPEIERISQLSLAYEILRRLRLT
jgi:hypothetical protein